MVQLVSNVVYAQVPDRGYVSKAMTMDLLVPCGEGPYPAIVYINGGGFINANKDGYIQQRLELAEHGYVVASITYRIAPASTFPAPLEDVKSAIRYLRAHADQFHIDSQHIGVMGGSSPTLCKRDHIPHPDKDVAIKRTTTPRLIFFVFSNILIAPQLFY